MTKIIEYFYSIGSPWSLLGLDPLLALAEKEGAELTPHLTTVVEENGGIFSRNRPEVRRAYWTREIRRWSRVRGKQLRLDDRPALKDPTPASLMVIAAYLDGRSWTVLSKALQEAFWIDAEDIGDPEVRKRIADKAGFNGVALLLREQDDDVQAKWANDRKYAVEKGVFGFPSHRYDGELYWGQDNLPFLERHLQGDVP